MKEASVGDCRVLQSAHTHISHELAFGSGGYREGSSNFLLLREIPVQVRFNGTRLTIKGPFFLLPMKSLSLAGATAESTFR